ncbi:PREDICTED: uncharacterized protein LOC109193498 [Ipomoea nil]|uniref:uncharacterized protein LOC109193498 n=1 Tax=Ipomoea nil TaxID=35883 RepID=UPI00090201BF|nr:PREDICTED: uncharacterized protein LOC109193498 [Ipomoea nil]XP_019199883.1 PREDICTED: uncharacterized protein LOC109193498 [Ipomoea nil]
MGPSQNVSSQSAAIAMEPQNGISNGEKSSTTENDKSTPEAVSSDAANSSSSISSNLTNESPSTQVMERPTKESCRIPPSVFAKQESGKETEWSVASNESLFSIYLDNMSFSRDQFLWNSEELGGSSESRMHDLSPVASSSNLGNGGFDGAETSMREFLRDSKDQNHGGKCKVEVRPCRLSHASTTSGKSFAFPILTGDVDKPPSTKSRPEKKQPQPLPSPSPLPQQERESLETPQAEQKVAAPKRWFSCFLCCSCCS